MKVIDSLHALKQSCGQPLATSPWHRLDQSRIDLFAEATGDHQWIHVNPVRAATESPFGTTVAHGFLTLSLIPLLAQQSYRIEGFATKINYGLNQVRFVQPVPAGGRVRARFQPVEVIEKERGQLQLVMDVTLELEGCDRPACVAQTLVLLCP